MLLTVTFLANEKLYFSNAVIFVSSMNSVKLPA